MINTIIIDIETMDVRPTALILSIGGFAFDLMNIDETRTNILEVNRSQEVAAHSPVAFYGLVDAFDQLMLGRTVNRDTQQFWKKQDDEAREALEGECISLATQLLDLSLWIASYPNVRIFFRGTDFDGAILENAYRACGIDCPWHYAGKRDIRTYIDAMTKGHSGKIKGHQPCFTMIKHHALHDAMNDADQMCLAYSTGGG